MMQAVRAQKKMTPNNTEQWKRRDDNRTLIVFILSLITKMAQTYPAQHCI